ncbi:hypothetical protein D9758_003911 [Tetrapyrgos nigripes]|uniref:Deacetylase sirtuin-type domain-containing protein n=1 Tax=Tetrapyrgos nigripes TaxID=182062 RepID=A0A8H5GLP8_9AGAR|nr:hypothetical protein D9758_003911 [Tetrapyrgos nigripes]
MTLLLPLGASAPAPTHPSFVLKPPDTQNQLEKVFKTILKAKRIVVICGKSAVVFLKIFQLKKNDFFLPFTGAGISVHAGIPDFRSPEGLFQTLKRDNPKEALASGKDLFDASVFKSETMTTLFCQMISHLSDLSETAEPTPFHKILHTLDTTCRLLRVYTQNIDAIEQKCGLTFGVPEFESKRNKSRGKGKETAKESILMEPLPTPPDETPVDSSDPGPSTSRVSTPSTASSSSTAPRCIPLHGTLQTLHCQVCKHSFPLSSHLPSLASGIPPDCPECVSMETTRQLIGKRARGIGKLRPSVVLYNEEHKDGEGVGEIVSRDLMGSKGKVGADLLLVVGTSLKVPGTKRMVREFAKAVHSRGSGAKDTEKEKDKGKEKGKEREESKSTSSSPGPSKEEDANQQSAQQPLKALYLNLDFPVPTREWEGVFDAWIQGDAQSFAEMLRAEIEKDARAKEVAKEVADERRRKRELKEKEQEAMASTVEGQGDSAVRTLARVKSKSKKKRDHDEGAVKKRKNDKASAVPGHTTPTKKRKMVVLLPTPMSVRKEHKRVQPESHFGSSSSSSDKHRKRTPPLLSLASYAASRSLPSPPSPKSPSYADHSTDYAELDHRISTKHSSSSSSYQHSCPRSPTLPRTPISKLYPSSLNWTLPTPEQSPALCNVSMHTRTNHHTHSPRKYSGHGQYSQSSYEYSDHYSYESHDHFYALRNRPRSRSQSPIHYQSRSYSSYHSHSEHHTKARGSSLSPPSSPSGWIPQSQSHRFSLTSSGQTSMSSSSISSPIDSVSDSEESSETEADVDSDMFIEDDGVARVGCYFGDSKSSKSKSQVLALPPSNGYSQGRINLLSSQPPKYSSMSYSHHQRPSMDADEEIDIEGISDDNLSSPVDDLRTRLGMSCVRTTQFAGAG